MTTARFVRLTLIAPHDTVATGQSLEQAVNSQLDATLAAHPDAVYRYALRLTQNPEQAQDLTQETMLRAWRKRRAVNEPGAVKTWLLRIATNLWTDELRRKKHQPGLLVEPATSREPSTHQKLTQRESVAEALAALDRLPPRQRQVLYLISVEGLTHTEVADVLSLTPQAVKANLAAGRKTIRTQLRELYNEVLGTRTCPNANDSMNT